MSDGLQRAARHAREVVLAGLRAAGGLERIADSAWRRERLLILCYHGVSIHDEHDWNGGLFMSPAFLRRRFEFLRDRRYTVLPLAEAVSRLRSGTLPPRSVAITFDDGFYDYFSLAVPLLEEFGFPATNYMSTYYCTHQLPIPLVTLRYLLWRARERSLAPGTLPGQESAVELADLRQRERLARHLLEKPAVLAGGSTAQQELLAEVAKRFDVDLKSILDSRCFHLMSPDEVADVARRGFDLQLHTHRHRSPRDKAAFCGELQENRRLLEDMTGRSATHFCYPSGDVDPMFLPWLRDLGVETATTTGTADLATGADDPLLLPRFVDTMNKSELMFESWLSGAGAMLRLRVA